MLVREPKSLRYQAASLMLLQPGDAGHASARILCARDEMGHTRTRSAGADLRAQVLAVKEIF